ncbi:hypothetical protein KEM48_010036 [Puccinia striiformis f. sp. tritici PST-130]|nr:hypothetical protein KEM48_010036 [Puccinia striiformis f. sp. tritici PST-130]
MSQLADHSRDRELLYATLGGLQPVGTCLAWVVGLTICEALRLTQRFDPKTSLIKRIFVYFSLVILFLALIYLLAVVNYGQYRKLLDITGIFRFDYMVTRIATLGGLTYYSYDVWHSEMGKIKMWRIPIIKVSIVANLQNVSRVLEALRPRSNHICGLIPSAVDHLFRGNMSRYNTSHKASVCICYGSIGLLTSIIEIPHLKLIEGAVLTFLKAYDLVKSGAVKKVLATRDDPSVFYPSSDLHK